MILRRLHVAVPQPKPIIEYYPPRWLGVLSILAFFAYNYTFAKPLENAILQSLLQIIGIVGYIILMCFGAIAISLLIRLFLTRAKLVNGLLTALSIFVMPQILLILGIFYISGSLHDYIARRSDLQTAAADGRTVDGRVTRAADRQHWADAGDHSLSDRARLVPTPKDGGDIIDLGPDDATDVK